MGDCGENSIGARVSNLEQVVRLLPSKDQLIELSAIYKKLLDLNDELMYTDRSCVVNAEHHYKTLPRFEADPTHRFDAPNKEYVDNLVKKASDEYLKLNVTDYIQVIKGPVKFEDTVKFEKASNIAYTDKGNKFLLAQTFLAGIDADGQTVRAGNVAATGEITATGNIIGSGNLILKGQAEFGLGAAFKGNFSGDANSSLGCGSIRADNAIIEKTLTVGDIPGRVPNAGTAIIGGDLWVTGVISCDKFDVKDLQFTTLGGKTLNVNDIVITAKTGKINCYDIDAANIMGEDIKATSLQPPDDESSLEIKASNIKGENIYVVENNQEFEVINSSSHYLFNKTVANFKTYRPETDSPIIDITDLSNINKLVKVGDLQHQQQKPGEGLAFEKENNYFTGKNTFKTNPFIETLANAFTYPPADNQLTTFADVKQYIKENPVPELDYYNYVSPSGVPHQGLGIVKGLDNSNDVLPRYAIKIAMVKNQGDDPSKVSRSIVGFIAPINKDAPSILNSAAWVTDKEFHAAYLTAENLTSQAVLSTGPLKKKKSKTNSKFKPSIFTAFADYEEDDVPNVYEVTYEFNKWLQEWVKPKFKRLVANFSEPGEALLPDKDAVYGPLTGMGGNIGAVEQLQANGQNAIIPAYVSHYPYADMDGDTAIVFAQEKITYHPPVGDEPGYMDYTPNQATPRCLVGSTLFNEGINVLTNIGDSLNSVKKYGWYNNDEPQSIFVVSGKGTTKYGGNDNKPFINMLADVTIHPEIPGPGNLKWPSHFNINTQCCVRLPSNTKFVIRPLQEYSVTNYGIGIPNYANESDEDNLISIMQSEENGFWEFICQCGAFIKKGIKVGIEIAQKISPVVSAISQVIGNEERPVWKTYGDFILEPYTYSRNEMGPIPRFATTSTSVIQKVLATSGTAWSLQPFTIQTIRGVKSLRDQDSLIDVMYGSEENDLWTIFTRIQALFEKALKVCNIIEDTYHSVLEVINKPSASNEYMMPTINMAGNVIISGSAIVDDGGIARSVPTNVIVDGKSYYTYGAQASDDTEIATHAYVLAHGGGGGGEGYVKLDSDDTTQTLQGAGIILRHNDITIDSPESVTIDASNAITIGTGNVDINIGSGTELLAGSNIVIDGGSTKIRSTAGELVLAGNDMSMSVANGGTIKIGEPVDPRKPCLIEMKKGEEIPKYMPGYIHFTGPVPQYTGAEFITSDDDLTTKRYVDGAIDDAIDDLGDGYLKLDSSDTQTITGGGLLNVENATNFTYGLRVTDSDTNTQLSAIGSTINLYDGNHNNCETKIQLGQVESGQGNYLSLYHSYTDLSGNASVSELGIQGLGIIGSSNVISWTANSEYTFNGAIPRYIGTASFDTAPDNAFVTKKYVAEHGGVPEGVAMLDSPLGDWQVFSGFGHRFASMEVDIIPTTTALIRSNYLEVQTNSTGTAIFGFNTWLDDPDADPRLLFITDATTSKNLAMFTGRPPIYDGPVSALTDDRCLVTKGYVDSHTPAPEGVAKLASPADTYQIFTGYGHKFDCKNIDANCHSIYLSTHNEGEIYGSIQLFSQSLNIGGNDSVVNIGPHVVDITGDQVSIGICDDKRTSRGQMKFKVTTDERLGPIGYAVFDGGIPEYGGEASYNNPAQLTTKEYVDNLTNGVAKLDAPGPEAQLFTGYQYFNCEKFIANGEEVRLTASAEDPTTVAAIKMSAPAIMIGYRAEGIPATNTIQSESIHLKPSTRNYELTIRNTNYETRLDYTAATLKSVVPTASLADPAPQGYFEFSGGYPQYTGSGYIRSPKEFVTKEYVDNLTFDYLEFITPSGIPRTNMYMGNIPTSVTPPKFGVTLLRRSDDNSNTNKTDIYSDSITTSITGTFIKNTTIGSTAYYSELMLSPRGLHLEHSDYGDVRVENELAQLSLIDGSEGGNFIKLVPGYIYMAHSPICPIGENDKITPNTLVTKSYVDATTTPKNMVVETSNGQKDLGPLAPVYREGRTDSGVEYQEVEFNANLYGLPIPIGLVLRRAKNGSGKYRDMAYIRQCDGSLYPLAENENWYNPAQ